MSRVIVVGTGIAGLTTALRLAGTHEVTVVTKSRLGESNTALAQGGIAGVLTADDTVGSHIDDTLTAGAGLGDAEAVRVLCTEGPDRILDLAEAGVVFDRNRAGGAGSHSPAEVRVDPLDPAGWARGIEGAHSAPRIYHSGGDATGRAIVDALVSRLLAEATAGTVDLRTETLLVDLVVDGETVTGVSVLGCGGVPEVIPAEAVVLATGGAGQVFAHTTNPPGATGDGLAAAIRAGAAVRDLEFVQFHPTALVGSGFLVSEAVRGAGALLLDARGRRFMPDIDPRAELAPRNVVALALHRAMAEQNGLPCHLDARAVPDVSARFPSIAATLAAQGLSLADDLIPVTPAAHYVMGGVATDLDGRTSLPGLFAVGEVACTGVHGANRLASNSLLEGAVFGARAAEAITADRRLTRSLGARSAAALSRPAPALPHPAPLSRAELQALTWEHLGLERTEEGLMVLFDRLGEDTDDHLGESHGIGRAADGTGVHGFPVDHLGEGDHVQAIETANLALIARAMAVAALARTESVGAHVRTDVDARRTAASWSGAGHPVLDRNHEEAASC
ncbi:L-aspartate oxidase [Brevibacterium casei]|uniref:L-aspartate oxidase n=1 Tax=Brevibacterium casei TaxID=33889 RepID=UPI0021AE5B42|nr:L-aspartate oxidase [Brevibacterium casei]MCT1446323.1 L-aspartate oxidase [Brevibacterium casei]